MTTHKDHPSEKRQDDKPSGRSADDPNLGVAPYSPGPSYANRPDRPDPGEIPPDFHLPNPKGSKDYVAGQPVSEEEFDYTQEQAERRKAHGDKMAKDAVEASERGQRETASDQSARESAEHASRDLSGRKPEEDAAQLRPHDRNSPELSSDVAPGSSQSQSHSPPQQPRPAQSPQPPQQQPRPPSPPPHPASKK